MNNTIVETMLEEPIGIVMQRFDQMMKMADALREKGQHAQMGLWDGPEGFCSFCRTPWSQCVNNKEK